MGEEPAAEPPQPALGVQPPAAVDGEPATDLEPAAGREQPAMPLEPVPVPAGTVPMRFGDLDRGMFTGKRMP